MENEIEQEVKTTADAETFAEHKAMRAPAPSPAPEQAEKPPEAPKPEPEKPSEAAKAEKPEADKSAVDSEPAEPSTQEQEHKRRDRSAEGRISELTARSKRAEEEAASLRKRLDEFQAAKPAVETRSEPPARTEATDSDPKPKLKTFLDREDVSYEDAQDQWEDAVSEWRDRKRQVTARQQSIRETMTSKVDAARAEFADFDEVTRADARAGTGLILTPPMQQYALESEEAMKVLYHLGKNPEVHQRIVKLSPVRQIAELARIEASLTASPDNGGSSVPEKPRQPISRAPAPPRIVGGVETTARRDTSDAQSMEEFRRIRQAQLKR